MTRLPGTGWALLCALALTMLTVALLAIPQPGARDDGAARNVTDIEDEAGTTFVPGVGVETIFEPPFDATAEPTAPTVPVTDAEPTGTTGNGSTTGSATGSGRPRGGGTGGGTTGGNGGGGSSTSGGGGTTTGGSPTMIPPPGPGLPGVDPKAEQPVDPNAVISVGAQVVNIKPEVTVVASVLPTLGTVDLAIGHDDNETELRLDGVELDATVAPLGLLG